MSLPNILVSYSFEEILELMVAKIKEKHPAYEPLESDSWMVVLEAAAYVGALLDERTTQKAKSLLLRYSSKESLDELAYAYDVYRLKGAKPYARYEFSLNVALNNDVVIPALLELGSDDGLHRAYLQESITIKAGELKTIGIVVYGEEVMGSEIKCENLLTSMPFALNVKALENFANGSEQESDSSLKERAILSLHSHTTAGSAKSYLFHARSADERIDDVAVLTEKSTPGIVDVYLHSNGGVDELMLERVEKALNGEKVRPLTDLVRIHQCTYKEITIKAQIYVFDLKQTAELQEHYKEVLQNRKFKIGEDLPLSEIIANLHSSSNIYKVVLETPSADVTPIDKKEVIQIIGLDLEFKEAPYNEASLKGENFGD